MASHRVLHCLLAPFGSEGDVAPFLWLADRLVERGHRVTVAVNPLYAGLVERRGHVVLPIGDGEKLQAMMNDPRVWQGHKGSQLLLRNLLASLPAYTEPYLSLPQAPDLVIGSTFALGAGFAAEARGVPFVHLHLQPSMLRSTRDLPVLGEGWEWTRRLPAPALRLFFGALNLALDGGPLRQINAYRATLRLPRLRSFYWDVMHGGTAVGGLFPEWYAPAQPEWPRGFRLLGFPVTPPEKSGELDAATRTFLAAGEAPVLWTHGSANFHTREFIHAAVQASAALGLRAIVVARGVASALPSADPSVLPLEYAPFATLFPRCRAVVHHGGIGTMVQALQAGQPQLVIPRAFDQFDNAFRAERLGFARQLRFGRLGHAAGVLRDLLATSAATDAAVRYAPQCVADPQLLPWLESIAAAPRLARSRPPVQESS